MTVHLRYPVGDYGILFCPNQLEIELSKKGIQELRLKAFIQVFPSNPLNLRP